jgi:hypothetical protein
MTPGLQNPTVSGGLSERAHHRILSANAGWVARARRLYRPEPGATAGSWDERAVVMTELGGSGGFARLQLSRRPRLSARAGDRPEVRARSRLATPAPKVAPPAATVRSAAACSGRTGSSACRLSSSVTSRCRAVTAFALGHRLAAGGRLFLPAWPGGPRSPWCRLEFGVRPIWRTAPGESRQSAETAGTAVRWGLRLPGARSRDTSGPGRNSRSPLLRELA